MRVFVFGVRGFPLIGGGAERHSEELYPRLSHGYDITVLARTVYFDNWKGIKFEKINYIKNRFLETMSHSIACTFYALKHRPDIVHIHNMGACLLVPLFNMVNIKVVLTLHSFNYLHRKWGLLSKLILQLCECIGVNFSNSIITVSKEMQDTLVKKYQRPLGIKHISNAVPPPERVAPGYTLKKYGLEPKNYILAVGRIVPEKGFDILVKAQRNKKLVIVGDGDTKYAQDLRRKSKDVIFTGHLHGTPLAELYTNAGLMALTSYQEGSPLVLLEALSYEIPIVASNITPYRHIELSPYRYYTVDDVEELSRKLKGLFGVDYTDEQKYKYKHMLENEYNWDKVAKKVKEIYG